MKPTNFNEFAVPSPGAVAAGVPKPPALAALDDEREKLLARIEQIGTELRDLRDAPANSGSRERISELEKEFAQLRKRKSEMRAAYLGLRSAFGEDVERALRPLISSDARETLRALIAVRAGLSRILEAQTALARAGGDGRQFGIPAAFFEVEAMLRGFI